MGPKESGQPAERDPRKSPDNANRQPLMTRDATTTKHFR
jgi:hypothetical protein